jgi:hypothetical protein
LTDLLPELEKIKTNMKKKQQNKKKEKYFKLFRAVEICERVIQQGIFKENLNFFSELEMTERDFFVHSLTTEEWNIDWLEFLLKTQLLLEK